jgi:predicted transposase/invertase (TIGR01784 family)
MEHYLDPKNDLTFKRVFAEHPDLLISFLNALMPLAPEHQIKEIEYLPPEQVPDIPGKKNSIVDVKCKDKYGNVFIIEMQMHWTYDFLNRILFNASKAYVRQLDRSENYITLKPVYTLAILNENFNNDKNNEDKFYHHFQIVNRENNLEIIKGLEFVFVELRKFTSDRWSNRKVAALWLRFLKEVGESMTELPPEMAENEQIRQAAELCRVGAFTPTELEAYEKYWDIIRTEKTLIEASIKKGRAEGEAIGLEKGEAIGLEKGRAEELEKIVINSHRTGMAIDTVATITGLTAEQITEILKPHGI